MAHPTREQVLKFNAAQLNFYTFLNTTLSKVISVHNTANKHAEEAAALKLKVDAFQTSIDTATDETLTAKFVNDLVNTGNALVTAMTTLSAKQKQDEANGNMSFPSADTVSTTYNTFKSNRSTQEVQPLIEMKDELIKKINELSSALAKSPVQSSLAANIASVKEQLAMLAPVKKNFDEQAALLAAQAAQAAQKSAAYQAQNANRTFSPKRSAPVVAEDDPLIVNLMGCCRI